MEVVVLDFETTGFSPDKGDRVIEIGAAIVDSTGQICNRLQLLCNPARSIPAVITRLTGICDDMLINSPSTESAISRLCDFIADRIIVAHNSEFDIRFLRSELQRIGKIVVPQHLCTWKLSRKLLPSLRSHKLGVLKDHIGYKEDCMHKDHRALDDVLVTVHLWNHLIPQVRSKWPGTAINHASLSAIYMSPEGGTMVQSSQHESAGELQQKKVSSAMISLKEGTEPVKLTQVNPVDKEHTPEGTSTPGNTT